jgi:hypothetical protein
VLDVIHQQVSKVLHARNYVMVVNAKGVSFMVMGSIRVVKVMMLMVTPYQLDY